MDNELATPMMATRKVGYFTIPVAVTFAFIDGPYWFGAVLVVLWAFVVSTVLFFRSANKLKSNYLSMPLHLPGELLPTKSQVFSSSLNESIPRAIAALAFFSIAYWIIH